MLDVILSKKFCLCLVSIFLIVSTVISVQLVNKFQPLDVHDYVGTLLHLCCRCIQICSRVQNTRCLLMNCLPRYILITQISIGMQSTGRIRTKNMVKLVSNACKVLVNTVKNKIKICRKNEMDTTAEKLHHRKL